MGCCGSKDKKNAVNPEKKRRLDSADELNYDNDRRNNNGGKGKSKIRKPLKPEDMPWRRKKSDDKGGECCCCCYLLNTII